MGDMGELVDNMHPTDSTCDFMSQHESSPQNAEDDSTTRKKRKKEKEKGQNTMPFPASKQKRRKKKVGKQTINVTSYANELQMHSKKVSCAKAQLNAVQPEERLHLEKGKHGVSAVVKSDSCAEECSLIVEQKRTKKKAKKARKHKRKS